LRSGVSVDITEKSFTVISFCSGYGGIERGLDLAGVKHRVIAYVEIEAFAIANLVSKMESGQLVPAPIYTDLKTFPAHIFRGCVDIITGGYPCQPFSAAGKRLGTEDPRHLWPYILDHIKAIRPVRCFFENVEGHISLGLREVIGDLEGAGYQATWGIFSAAEVGAPHQRKRVYILGSNRDWDTNCIDDSQKQGISQGQDSQPSGVCTDVADTGIAGLPQRDRQGASTKGQPYAESQCGGGLPPDLADTGSKGLQGAKGPRGAGTERQPNGHSAECGAELADSKNKQYNIRKPRNMAETSSRGECGNATVGFGGSNGDSRFSTVADPISARSEIGLSGPERPDEEGQAGMHWSFEPSVGQLVNGNTSRLDGLRRLGINANERWLQIPCEKDAEACLRELRKYTKALCPPHRSGLDEQQPFKYTDALQFLSHVGAPPSGGHPDSGAETAMSALRQNILSAGVVLDTSDAPETLWESLADAEKAWIAMATCHGCNWESIPIGRVTTECPNRVDRIRLLGNGVVPQTAAKAWTTLTSRGKK
jgi:site-specific DNA-cytosine methylase